MQSDGRRRYVSILACLITTGFAAEERSRNVYQGMYIDFSNDHAKKDPSEEGSCPSSAS
jgi:hypothetical protein